MCRIWDVELSAVLEIEKVGHRKRILASVSGGEHITPGPRLEDINADLNMLVSLQFCFYFCKIEIEIYCMFRILSIYVRCFFLIV